MDEFPEVEMPSDYVSAPVVGALAGLGVSKAGDLGSKILSRIVPSNKTSLGDIRSEKDLRNFVNFYRNEMSRTGALVTRGQKKAFDKIILNTLRDGGGSIPATELSFNLARASQPSLLRFMSNLNKTGLGAVTGAAAGMATAASLDKDDASTRAMGLSALGGLALGSTAVQYSLMANDNAYHVRSKELLKRYLEKNRGTMDTTGYMKDVVTSNLRNLTKSPWRTAGWAMGAAGAGAGALISSSRRRENLEK